MTPFTEEYYMRGKSAGVSNYENYSWKPELTIPVVKLMTNYLGAPKGASFMDYGCSRGFYCKALRLLEYEAYGYDISEWAILNRDPAVKDCVSNNPRILKSTFDFVFCKDTLEHIPRPELDRVTRSLLDMTLKAALIIVPLAGTSGVTEEPCYVSPVDRSDSTHVICWTLPEWLMFIQGMIDTSGLGFTVNGGYKIPGVKKSADPYPQSCGFLTIRRFEL